MRRIAVSLTKGGVGKTTTAVTLAHGLALRGRKVLLVDCDTLGQAGPLLGLSPTVGLADLLSGNLPPDKAIVEARKNLDLLAGGRALDDARRAIDRDGPGGVLTLRRALEPVEPKYDYVIHDTSPGYDSLTVNALFHADDVLIPVSMAALSVKGLLDFAHRIKKTGAHDPSVGTLYILPSFLNEGLQHSMDIYDLLQTYFSKQLCQPIRSSAHILEASGHGKTIFEYAPDSQGAHDYKSLVDRIERGTPGRR
ncbi:ParA family protein [Candidatus Fermentibacteria bacterium]|nr:ParA family protein [Candidatus Fermentibacteria bacterium]